MHPLRRLVRSTNAYTVPLLAISAFGLAISLATPLRSLPPEQGQFETVRESLDEILQLAVQRPNGETSDDAVAAINTLRDGISQEITGASHAISRDENAERQKMRRSVRLQRRLDRFCAQARLVASHAQTPADLTTAHAMMESLIRDAAEAEQAADEWIAAATDSVQNESPLLHHGMAWLWGIQLALAISVFVLGPTAVRGSVRRPQDAIAVPSKAAFSEPPLRRPTWDIVEHFPTAAFVTDEQGYCSFVNQFGCELTGLSVEQSLGMGWVTVLHPQERDRVIVAWRDFVERGVPYHQEHRFLRPDGTERWVSSRVLSVRDSRDGTVEYIGSLTDITRLKQSEQRHAESERRFRELADSAPVLIWETGVTKKCTYVNRQWVEFRGTSFESELGEGWTAGIHPEDLDRVLATCIAAFEQRAPVFMEFRLRRHDGEYRWLLDNGVPRTSADGSFAGYIGTCIDVTDRRIAEERLKRSEERFELAMRGSNDAVWDCELTTNEFFCSPRFAEMLGYQPHEVPSSLEMLSELLHPADVERFQSLLNDHLKNDVPYDVQHRLRVKSGEFRWVRFRGRAVRDASGRAIRVTGSATDVTDQRTQHEALVRFASEMEEARSRIEDQAAELAHKAEELAAATARAQTASRSKGEFLANMSHEIRTPLNAILGMTELVLAGSLSNDQRDMVSMAHSSAEHLLALINDILDFSKIEAQKLRLDETDFDLRECIEQTLAMFRLSAKKKGLQLTSRIPPDVPNLVHGDANRLRQIFVNLVGNAVKFTERGHVSLSTVVREKSDSSIQLQFTVSDTGIGIERDKIETIFSPFEQADGSTTRRYGGSGLGLSIVRRLTELMQGRVWVESVPGQGSQFHCIVELRPAANPSARKTGTHEARELVDVRRLPQKLRILVAEDHPVNQKLVERMLTSDGHQVLLAGDGERAVQVALTEPLDLVLMDMQMPITSGIEATMKIRQAERGRGWRLPIIAVTANALQGDREACLDAGMDGYVSKPIRRSDLFQEIARVMANLEMSTERLCLHSLRERLGDDANSIREVLETFVETAPDLHQRLVAAVQANQCEEVRACAHTLRGAVGLLGRQDLGDQLAALEMTTADELADSERDLADAVLRELETLRSDVQAYLKQHSSTKP